MHPLPSDEVTTFFRSLSKQELSCIGDIVAEHKTFSWQTLDDHDRKVAFNNNVDPESGDTPAQRDENFRVFDAKLTEFISKGYTFEPLHMLGNAKLLKICKGEETLCILKQIEPDPLSLKNRELLASKGVLLNPIFSSGTIKTPLTATSESVLEIVPECRADLEKFLKNVTPEFRLTTSLFYSLKMAKILEILAQNGILHADPKLSNFLINMKGKLVMSDLKALIDDVNTKNIPYSPCALPRELIKEHDGIYEPSVNSLTPEAIDKTHSCFLAYGIISAVTEQQVNSTGQNLLAQHEETQAQRKEYIANIKDKALEDLLLQSIDDDPKKRPTLAKFQLQIKKIMIQRALDTKQEDPLLALRSEEVDLQIELIDASRDEKEKKLEKLRLTRQKLRMIELKTKLERNPDDPEDKLLKLQLEEVKSQILLAQPPDSKEAHEDAHQKLKNIPLEIKQIQIEEALKSTRKSRLKSRLLDLQLQQVKLLRKLANDPKSQEVTEQLTNIEKKITLAHEKIDLTRELKGLKQEGDVRQRQLLELELERVQLEEKLTLTQDSQINLELEVVKSKIILFQNPDEPIARLKLEESQLQIKAAQKISFAPADLLQLGFIKKLLALYSKQSTVKIAKELDAIVRKLEATLDDFFNRGAAEKADSIKEAVSQLDTNKLNFRDVEDALDKERGWFKSHSAEKFKIVKEAFEAAKQAGKPASSSDKKEDYPGICKKGS